jgi:ArsR family transcriptional regulator
MRKTIATISGCCSPISGTALSAEEAARTAALFKLLSDPTRLRLVSLIAAAEGGEVCVCDLPEALGVSQPTVSHHLKALHGGGLVTREQRGKWAYYAIDTPALGALGEVLST